MKVFGSIVSLDWIKGLRDGSRMTELNSANQAYAGKPVLVTGGAGFIGSHLVEALVRVGARVRVLDDLSTGNRDNLKNAADKIDFIVGDIRDADLCLRAAEGVAVIFHLAAFVSVPESLQKPDRTFAINLFGSSHIFEAAARHAVSRVVYASSCAVYGDCSTMPLRESHSGRMLSPYAVSKRSVEHLAEYAFAGQNLSTVGLRFFNVYGPRQSPRSAYAAVIPLYIESCLAGRAPKIFGDGTQTRDFIHVDDVVRANMLAGVAQGVQATVANVGTGIATSIQALAAMSCEFANTNLLPQFLEARPGDISRSVCDTQHAEHALGFKAEVSLREGIKGLFRIGPNPGSLGAGKQGA